jgi:hypothetical protein
MICWGLYKKRKGVVSSTFIQATLCVGAYLTLANSLAKMKNAIL